MRKAKVINCHELSIRRAPWYPELDEEVVCTVKAGESVKVLETDNLYYGWTGRAYYLVESPNGNNGYALKDCLEFED